MTSDAAILTFGKHEGTPITRVPVSYLRWMVNNNTRQADQARVELKRRGSTFPRLEISGHAIDRASQRLLETWQSKRKKGEGLHSWLVRMVEKALKGGVVSDGKIKFRGIVFVFDHSTVEWPVLMTVMVNEKRNGDGR